MSEVSARPPLPVAEVCRRIVAAPLFNQVIIGLIILNGVAVGLETSAWITERFGSMLHGINQLILAAFVVEALVKMAAHGNRPWRYFASGWNCFDFSIIALSLIPAAGPLATLARLVRVLRVLRLVSAFPELRLLVDTLLRSLPSMFHIALLMGIIFYIYGVAGYFLFHEIDPTHWRSLPIALLSLFRIVTFEDWTDIMYTAMEAMPWAWVYFVSFVVMGAFVMINLFIGVVLNNLEEAKLRRLDELQLPPSQTEILRELRATQEALARLQKRMQDVPAPSADRTPGGSAP
ncbi:ion transporter [Microbulbifer flavimaris]|uniref:Ion transporter n=1 Tax=Microbulbifer flavimaris TaxID=1781068 RepID=A0ABX4HXV7_9GAMM|nr:MULTISPECIES: ion transporter [Microbulbifer]KUJ82768.1 ion transporter [Microbulbifer sp. ZGT114]PCO04944.1 ion transporter [Microbulbifer flavimaris]